MLSHDSSADHTQTPACRAETCPAPCSRRIATVKVSLTGRGSIPSAGGARLRPAVTRTDVAGAVLGRDVPRPDPLDEACHRSGGQHEACRQKHRRERPPGRIPNGLNVSARAQIPARTEVAPRNLGALEHRDVQPRRTYGWRSLN